MSNNFLVVNHETGQRMKYKQAVKLEAEGSIIWVEIGKTFRNATRDDLPQILARRDAIAKQREHLEFAEIPGVVFEPPIKDRAKETERQFLAREADRFCESVNA